jgi:prevent-host-death family protein
MSHVNIHHAKTHFSSLLARVASGEEIVIAKSGTPIARIVPFSRPEPRVLGQDQGLFSVPDDFDAQLPEDVLGLFET